MFDFDPNDRPAPKLFLDPTSGLVLNKAPADVPPLGAAPSVTPTPTATSTSVDTTVSGTVGDTAPQAAVQAAATTRTVTPAPKIRLSCTSRGGGHKVTITCSAKGAAGGATSLRLRIVRRNKVLATAAAKLSHGRAKVTLRSKRALKKGRYTLRIAISHAGGVAGVTRTIRLR
jgi:phospholipase C